MALAPQADPNPTALVLGRVERQRLHPRLQVGREDVARVKVGAGVQVVQVVVERATDSSPVDPPPVRSSPWCGQMVEAAAAPSSSRATRSGRHATTILASAPGRKASLGSTRCHGSPPAPASAERTPPSADTPFLHRRGSEVRRERRPSVTSSSVQPHNGVRPDGTIVIGFPAPHSTPSCRKLSPQTPDRERPSVKTADPVALLALAL
jgi:hypothetical protein